MPTTLPGVSVAQAEELLQAQDRVLKSFPEVERVFGKAGRADTSTDPAPFSMMETTVVLKPESAWRGKERWYSQWAPEWTEAPVPPVLARPHLLRGADRRDGPRRCASRASPTPGPCRSRAASTCSTTGVRTPVGSQDLRRRPQGDRADRRASGGDPARAFPARAASTPSGWPAATSWTSCPGATSSPATASPSSSSRWSS